MRSSWDSGLRRGKRGQVPASRWQCSERTTSSAVECRRATPTSVRSPPLRRQTVRPETSDRLSTAGSAVGGAGRLGLGTRPRPLPAPIRHVSPSVAAAPFGSPLPGRARPRTAATFLRCALASTTSATGLALGDGGRLAVVGSFAPASSATPSSAAPLHARRGRRRSAPQRRHSTFPARRLHRLPAPSRSGHRGRESVTHGVDSPPSRARAFDGSAAASLDACFCRVGAAAPSAAGSVITLGIALATVSAPAAAAPAASCGGAATA